MCFVGMVDAPWAEMLLGSAWGFSGRVPGHRAGERQRYRARRGGFGVLLWELPEAASVIGWDGLGVTCGSPPVLEEAHGDLSCWGARDAVSVSPRGLYSPKVLALSPSVPLKGRETEARGECCVFVLREC